MRLRIKREPPTEAVAELFLESLGPEEVSLRCVLPNGAMESVAFFQMGDKTFHVFAHGLGKLGYTLTSDASTKEGKG